MSEIKSKIFNYGNEKEAAWPSQYGKRTRIPRYIDRDSNELKLGYPPAPKLNEKAPTVIFDSMAPQYHQAACKFIESRKEWQRADKETGSITFADKSEATPKVDAFFEKKKKKEEYRKASKTALEVYRANPKEVEQRVAKQAEQQMETLKKSKLTKHLKEAGVTI